MKFLNLFLTVQLFGSIAFAQIKINPIINPSGLPIKAERTISISTNESSYLDVDISPDGSTLLFSCLGELFSLPAKGGVATQLTRGLAMNSCPIWSPDGKSVAYISDANGFLRAIITDSKGQFYKALGNGNPESYQKTNLLWLPGNKQIVFGHNKIFDVIGASYSLPEQMVELLGFSLDGTYMYCIEKIDSDCVAIIKLNRFTNRAKRILVLSSRKYYYEWHNLNISPNGNFLTYIRYRYEDGVPTPADSLMMVDFNSGKEKLLAHLDIKFTGIINNKHYSFSKDSKYLFIGYGGKIHKIEIETGKNQIIPFTANVKVDMGVLDYYTLPVSFDSFEVKYIRSAQESPDGKQLVFSALNKIYIQDLPNGMPHILADQPFNQFQPTYSPDGKWICYVTWSDTAGGHLWRISLHGGHPEQITTIAGLYQHPSWSPDGNMIVVAKGNNKLGRRESPGDGHIEVIDVRDKTVSIYADQVPLFNSPTFSKDGKKINFIPKIDNYSQDYMQAKLVSVELATKEKTVLVDASKEEDSRTSPRQILLSPCCNYVVFMKNDDLYLKAVANVGSAEPIYDFKKHTPLIRLARGAIDPVWQEGGKILGWVNANQYCRINPSKIVEAAAHLSPNSILDGLSETEIIDVNIPADQTISIQLNVAKQYGKGSIAFKNVRIITMSGNNVIENGTVIIKDGRFVKIGKSNETAVPKGAIVLDLSGKTIIPGIIDMHSHMNESLSPDVFSQQSWQRLLNLSYGVTTKRTPAGSVDEFGYNELVEIGQMLGPRSYTVGPAVYSYYNLTSLSEAEELVGNRKKMGAVAIKQYLQPTRLQKQLLLEACKKARLNMTNEVEQGPLYCIGQFKDGSTGVEHNPIWGEVYDDVIKFVARSGTYLCPTLQVCFGKEEGKHYFHKLYGQDFINRSANFISENYRKKLEKEIKEDVLDTGFLQQSRIDARIKHAGGKIVMGSHGEDQGIGAHWEIWALQMGGLTNMEALQTATIMAAKALGMQKDLGSIEVGKIADLIILDKNPLDDIHNTNTIRYVMKAGVLYDSETLDEIWPKKKKCPEWRMKTDVPSTSLKAGSGQKEENK